MEFGRMHEIMACVSGYLVHLLLPVGKLFTAVYSYPSIRRALEIRSLQREDVGVLGACRDLEISLATKKPKNGLKIVAEFLQKCSTNLRFHL